VKAKGKGQKAKGKSADERPPAFRHQTTGRAMASGVVNFCLLPFAFCLLPSPKGLV
jgi:hypothetical protein